MNYIITAKDKRDGKRKEFSIPGTYSELEKLMQDYLNGKIKTVRNFIHLKIECINPEPVIKNQLTLSI